MAVGEVVKAVIAALSAGVEAARQAWREERQAQAAAARPRPSASPVTSTT